VQDLPNDAHNVIFTTDKPVSNITGFYRKQLEDAGWKLTQNAERGNHAFVSFKRGNMIANIQVAEDASEVRREDVRSCFGPRVLDI